MASGPSARGVHHRRRSTNRSTKDETAAISSARKTAPGKTGGLDPERMAVNPSGLRTLPGKVIPNWARSTRHPTAPTTPSPADASDHPLSLPGAAGRNASAARNGISPSPGRRTVTTGPGGKQLLKRNPCWAGWKPVTRTRSLMMLS